jgi:hypothetical protein
VLTDRCAKEVKLFHPEMLAALIADGRFFPEFTGLSTLVTAPGRITSARRNLTSFAQRSVANPVPPIINQLFIG